MVPNLYATIGQSAPALASLLSATEALTKGALSARDIEAVSLFASELNGCAYCVCAHTTLAGLAGISPDDASTIRRGQGANSREQAMLDLVRRMVRTGGTGAGTELRQARDAGLSDAAIIEVLAHTSLKAFTNAVAIVAQSEIDFPKPAHLPQP